MKLRVFYLIGAVGVMSLAGQGFMYADEVNNLVRRVGSLETEVRRLDAEEVRREFKEKQLEERVRELERKVKEMEAKKKEESVRMPLSPSIPNDNEMSE